MQKAIKSHKAHNFFATQSEKELLNLNMQPKR